MGHIGSGGSEADLRQLRNSRRAPPANLPQPPPKAPTKKANNNKGHHVTNGAYTHTRTGKAICKAFQQGDCQHGGMTHTCNYAHVCDKCLDNRHGSGYDYQANKATQCSKNPSLPSGAGGAGGKGKGGRKGKGKGKSGY